MMATSSVASGSMSRDPAGHISNVASFQGFTCAAVIRVVRNMLEWRRRCRAPCVCRSMHRLLGCARKSPVAIHGRCNLYVTLTNGVVDMNSESVFTEYFTTTEGAPHPGQDKTPYSLGQTALKKLMLCGLFWLSWTCSTSVYFKELQQHTPSVRVW